MAEMNPDDMSRFDNFNVLTTPYKTVHGHAITLNVIYPKSLTKSPSTGSPVMIRIHGGGLLAASSMFPDFFARWVLELAERHSAIIVSPDYRLIPEANGTDILEDIEEAWKWIHSCLSGYLEKEAGGSIFPDLNRIITAGESAGGYLSVILSLSHPDKIRSTMAQYPMIDLKSPFFSQDYEKSIFGMPQVPFSVMTDHLDKVKAGEAPAVVSADPRGARFPLAFVAIQKGLFKGYMDQNNIDLFPLERLARGDKFPRGGVFVCHGLDDSLVPIENSEKLDAVVKQTDPDLYFHLAKQPGEHGFDGVNKLNDDWLAEGTGPLIKAWLE